MALPVITRYSTAAAILLRVKIVYRI